MRTNAGYWSILALLTLPTLGLAESVEDCNFGFTVPDPTRVCLDDDRGWFLTDGDDSASIPDFLTLTIGGNRLTIDGLAGPSNPLNFDKFYFVSEAVANAPPANRPAMSDEIFGPFFFGLDGSNPVTNVLEAATLAAMINLQSQNPENILVLLEEQVGRDIFNPGIEGFGGLRFEGTVEIPPEDFGDAPAPYPTLSIDNGASHALVDNGPSLTEIFTQAFPDAEDDGQPDADAEGDDLMATDDEEGVLAPSGGVLIRGVTETFRLESDTAGALLDAWIDFNGDGDWGDAGEQVAANRVLVEGTNSLDVDVPMNAALGDTFSRFRVSSGGALEPTGPAADGEVEDHKLRIVDADFGDAPDSYGTTFAAFGAFHEFDPNLRLGARLDVELDGSPGPRASGDDLNPFAGLQDDEDGVSFDPNVIPGETLDVDITNGGNAAFVSIWIDFNTDGDFLDAGERVLDRSALAGGVTATFPIDVPVDADFGQSYMRVRLNDGFPFIGVLEPDDFGGPGEVEDHELFFILGFDYGDAPAPYPTLDAEDGARHPLLVDFHLGQQADADLDGQPDMNALGDDLGNQPDEDGVFFLKSSQGESLVLLGGDNTLEVEASRDGGQLHAWIDLNADGDWDDAGEFVVSREALGMGLNEVQFTAAEGTPGMTSVARFRLTFPLNIFEPDLTPDQSGLSVDKVGEVEDHQVRLIRRIFAGNFEDESSASP